MIDALAGFAGGKARWRTMPWMVVLFGILIIPPGVTSITLVILQPVAVGSWCSICLFTAVVMLIMVPFAFDEIVATLQYLYEVKKSGNPLWKTFWLGGEMEADEDEKRSEDKLQDLGVWSILSGDGVTTPWFLIVSCLIGAWLMYAPTFFNYPEMVANIDYFSGALIVTFAITSMAEICHSIRFLNIPIGAVLILSPVFLESFSTASLAGQVAAGIVLILVNLPKAKINSRFGGLDKYIY